MPAQEDFATRLKRVTQLTGLSDSVYAEAYVTVHSYDIMLDVLVVNQTKETMHNLCLELATVGDLKLCERPQSYVLKVWREGGMATRRPCAVPLMRARGCPRSQRVSVALQPGENKHIKANIKVSSTETGIVFGSIVYDAPAASAVATGTGSKDAAPAERNCVVLNDIHIDIMDYIAPASCSDLTFRAMWAEFEW